MDPAYLVPWNKSRLLGWAPSDLIQAIDAYKQSSHPEFLRQGYVFDQGWKFRAGDNSTWASATLNDLDWEDRERVLRLLFSKMNAGVPASNWRAFARPP